MLFWGSIYFSKRKFLDLLNSIKMKVFKLKYIEGTEWTKFDRYFFVDKEFSILPML